VNPAGEGQIENERRYRAEVERALRQGDVALQQAEQRFKQVSAYLEELEVRLAPLYGAAPVEPIVLTNDYQPLVLGPPPVRPIPTEAGTYYISVLLTLAGTNANAFAQLRISAGGFPLEGAEETIGNTDRVRVTSNFVLTFDSPNLLIEARGSNSSITRGTLESHRVGVGPRLT
jgi:hypothetical protein